MEFIVMRGGQVIHEEPLLPGAEPAQIGMPAIEGVGPDEHLGVNHVDGWKIRVDSLEELLRVVLAVEGQVMVRRPMDFLLNGQQAFVLDILTGIGQ